MRAYRVAYDGRPFHGFQRQPDVSTVEDAVFDALRRLDVLDDEKPAGYAAAGRTDAGVSALAQTVAFEAPEWLSPGALNSELPASVRAWASAEAPGDFHATHHAAFREYTYYLHAPGASVTLLKRACERLSGEHDLHNLTPDDRNTVRDLAIRLRAEGDHFVLVLRAGGFCRELVRRVVSLVAAVATGDRPMADVERALSSEHLSGPDGVAPAPAYPLVLTHVAYPDLTFQVDEPAAATARELFERRRVEALTGSRVLGELAEGVE